MNCPKCMTPIKEDSLFCPNCGAALGDETQNIVQQNDDMDKTMTIPVIKKSEVRESVKSVPAGVHHTGTARPAPKAAPNPSPVRKDNDSSQKGRKVLIFLVTFLITVVIGLSIALAVVLIGGKDTPETLQQPKSEEPKVSTSAAGESVDEEKPEEMQEGESVAIEAEEQGILVDTAFSFAYGKTLDSELSDYRTLKSTDYECALPEDFDFIFDSDGEIRYAAKDSTAYMDIGELQNESSMSAADVRNKAKRDLGGTVTYETEGDGWFIMNTDRDGVTYYQKCYVDELYIRYIEIVYPTEYSSVYNEYVNSIEPSFKITK